MMEQKKLSLYITAYLALFVPTPGRLVYGITLLLELNILLLGGILVDFLVKKFKFTEIRTYIVMTFLIFFTVIYRQIFAIAYSEVALTLGFLFYFPPVSLLLIDNILKSSETDFGLRIKKSLLNSLFFSFFGLILFLFRDIVCYGTFTFYGSKHQIFEKVLFNSDKIGLFSFFGTVPGVLCLIGVLFYLDVFFRNKMRIIKNSGEAE